MRHWEAECQGWKNTFLGIRSPRCYFQLWEHRPVIFFLLFYFFIYFFVYCELLEVRDCGWSCFWNVLSLLFIVLVSPSRFPLRYSLCLFSFIIFSSCASCALFWVIVSALDSSFPTILCISFLDFLFFKSAPPHWNSGGKNSKWVYIFSCISLIFYTFFFLSSARLFLLWRFLFVAFADLVGFLKCSVDLVCELIFSENFIWVLRVSQVVVIWGSFAVIDLNFLHCWIEGIGATHLCVVQVRVSDFLVIIYLPMF